MHISKILYTPSRLCTRVCLHTHIKCEAHQLRHTENSYVHWDAFMHTHTNLLHTELFTQRRSYTHTCFSKPNILGTKLHTKSFTHRWLQTHRIFYTQELLHTGAGTHRLWHGVPLHIVACTHKHRRNFEHWTPVYTETFTRRWFYTRKLLHTEASTDIFTYRNFFTQAPLRTDAFRHNSFYTEMPLSQENSTRTEKYRHILINTHWYVCTYVFTHKCL